jgi:membrane fusion protein, multidrug efflux system
MMRTRSARSESPAARCRARPPLLLLLCALAATGCGGGSTEEFETSDKVPVVVQPARRGPIRSAVNATGTVEPAPGAELLVVAPGPARILEMPRAAGDRVGKGDLLVRFEIPSLDAESSTRESDLRRAEARLAAAQASLTRIEGLFSRGIASGKEVEDARREMAEAEAAVSESKAGRSASTILAEREIVRAPFAGIVAARTHNPGDLVDPSTAEPILRVIDPDRLQVEASVPVAELPSLGEGRVARISGPESYPAEEARVRSLPVAVDPSTAIATVRLDFTARSRFPVGTPVTVTIVAEEHGDALLVPYAALVKEGEIAFAYTVDAEGKARRRQVKVGLAAGADVEILSGIDTGDRVVVEGQNALPDGAAVTVR